MKILCSSSKDNNLLAPQYVKELKIQGVTIEPTYIFEVVNYFRGSVLGKLILKFFPSFVYLFSNIRLLKDANHNKPDLIIIFKGMEIFPKTLKKLKTQNIFLVNYNPDHPFKYLTKASGNHNVKNSISLYNLHLTYSHHIKKEMNQFYPKSNVEVLPFGYPTYVNDLKTDLSEIKKVCFIGYADHNRASIISYLLEQGFEVHLYGKAWYKYLKPTKALTVFPPVEGLTYFQTLASYRVQLNLLRPHNFQSHNMRSFEIPAIGGIMLSMHSAEQSQYFREGQEAFYFNDQNELVKKINYIMSLSKPEINQIRHQARERSKNHSYYFRAQNLQQILNSNLA